MGKHYTLIKNKRRGRTKKSRGRTLKKSKKSKKSKKKKTRNRVTKNISLKKKKKSTGRKRNRRNRSLRGGSTSSTEGTNPSLYLELLETPPCVDNDAMMKAATIGQGPDRAGFTCADMLELGACSKVSGHGICDCSCPAPDIETEEETEDPDEIEYQMLEGYLSELKWKDIPLEHINGYYIPYLLSTPIDTEIDEEVSQWTEELVSYAKKRGIYDISKGDILLYFIKRVNKEHRDEIEEKLLQQKGNIILSELVIDVRPGFLKDDIKNLKEIELAIFYLVNDINRTIEGCINTYGKITNDNCKRLEKLNNEMDTLKGRQNQIKRDIARRYGRRSPY